MNGGPGNHLARRPDGREQRDSDRQQTLENLGEQAKQSEVHETEAECDARANIPGRLLWSRHKLDRGIDGEKRPIVSKGKTFHTALLVAMPCGDGPSRDSRWLFLRFNRSPPGTESQSSSN